MSNDCDQSSFFRNDEIWNGGRLIICRRKSDDAFYQIAVFVYLIVACIQLLMFSFLIYSNVSTNWQRQKEKSNMVFFLHQDKDGNEHSRFVSRITMISFYLYPHWRSTKSRPIDRFQCKTEKSSYWLTTYILFCSWLNAVKSACFVLVSV